MRRNVSSREEQIISGRRQEAEDVMVQLEDVPTIYIESARDIIFDVNMRHVRRVGVELTLLRGSK